MVMFNNYLLIVIPPVSRVPW